MTVAKAMKRKNRLVQEISVLRDRIRANNVTNDRNVSNRPVDVVALAKTLEEKLQELIRLKTALAKANVAIYEKIFTLAELKGVLQYLLTLQQGVRDGVYEENRGRFGDDANLVKVTYTPTFGFDVLEERIQAVTAQIDTLQEELETFNHSTQLVFE